MRGPRLPPECLLLAPSRILLTRGILNPRWTRGYARPPTQPESSFWPPPPGHRAPRPTELVSVFRSEFVSCCRAGELSRVLAFLRSRVLRPFDAEVNLGLRAAAASDAANVVEAMLLEHWVDVSARDSLGRTAFLTACAAGATNSLRILLASDRIIVNEVDDDGKTGLMLACSSGSLVAVELLLADHRTEVNARDNSLRTAFHYAAINGNISLLEALIAVPNIETEATDENGKTAADLASEPVRMFLRGAMAGSAIVGRSRGNKSVDSGLRTLRNEDAAGRTLGEKDLKVSVETEMAARASNALNSSADSPETEINENNSSNANDAYPGSIADQSSLDPELVDSRLAAQPPTSHPTSAKSFNPLHAATRLAYAASTGNTTYLSELLLDPRLDPNIPADPSSWPRSRKRPRYLSSALAMSILSRQTDSVSLLLSDPRLHPELPVDPPGFLASSTAPTPLHLAIITLQPPLISLLLSHPRIDPNKPQDSRGSPALHLTVARATTARDPVPPAQILRILMRDEKVDVNLQDAQGNTAFHTGSPKFLPFLPIILSLSSESGLDLTLRNEAGDRAVDLWRKAAAKAGGELLDFVGSRGWDVLAAAGVWSPDPSPSDATEPSALESGLGRRYEEMSVVELKDLCRFRGIKAFSKMRRAQLIEALSLDDGRRGR